MIYGMGPFQNVSGEPMESMMTARSENQCPDVPERSSVSTPPRTASMRAAEIRDPNLARVAVNPVPTYSSLSV